MEKHEQKELPNYRQHCITSRKVKEELEKKLANPNLNFLKFNEISNKITNNIQIATKKICVYN